MSILYNVQKTSYCKTKLVTLREFCSTAYAIVIVWKRTCELHMVQFVYRGGLLLNCSTPDLVAFGQGACGNPEHNARKKTYVVLLCSRLLRAHWLKATDIRRRRKAHAKLMNWAGVMCFRLVLPSFISRTKVACMLSLGHWLFFFLNVCIYYYNFYEII